MFYLLHINLAHQKNVIVEITQESINLLVKQIKPSAITYEAKKPLGRTIVLNAA